MELVIHRKAPAKCSMQVEEVKMDWNKFAIL